LTKTLIAAAAMALCAIYIAVNVHWNYGGNVTGLFFTGAQTRLPAELESEPTRRVSDPIGYDAQFYHLSLHDPLLRRGFSAYADNTRLRWRRIAVPGAAAAIHATTGLDLHWTYVVILLAFVFSGTFWLAAYSESLGHSPLLGVGFLAIPAALVSIDRMTVDLPLAALTVGFVLYSSRPSWPLYAILCAAPLVRETGMLLIAGWFVWNVIHRQSKAAGLSVACALPAFGWWLYVRGKSPDDATEWLARYPLSGVLDRLLAGESTPTTTAWLKIAWATEHLAFAGICLAIAVGVVLIRRKQFGPVEISAILFVAFASLLGRADIWNSAYATGRTMSPLLVLLGLIGLRDRRVLFLLPIALILPRIALQFEAQLKSAIAAAMRSG
jgi:hypothetical protein